MINYSANLVNTTPQMCNPVQCFLMFACTGADNYSTLFVTTPCFCIPSQRALEEKWSSFTSKSKHNIIRYISNPEANYSASTANVIQAHARNL